MTDRDVERIGSVPAPRDADVDDEDDAASKRHDAMLQMLRRAEAEGRPEYVPLPEDELIERVTGLDSAQVAHGLARVAGVKGDLLGGVVSHLAGGSLETTRDVNDALRPVRVAYAHYRARLSADRQQDPLRRAVHRYLVLPVLGNDVMTALPLDRVVQRNVTDPERHPQAREVVDAVLRDVLVEMLRNHPSAVRILGEFEPQELPMQRAA